MYTDAPKTVKKLYKQRLRWIYGFINNTIDYRSVLFRKKYGNFAIFTLPMGVISIFSISYLFGRIIYNVGDFIYSKIVVFSTIGWHIAFYPSRFDIFFLNSHSSFFLLIVFIYSLVLFAILFGRKMTQEKNIFSFNILYFFPVFSLIAPFWLARAVYNTIIQRKPSWR